MNVLTMIKGWVLNPTDEVLCAFCNYPHVEGYPLCDFCGNQVESVDGEPVTLFALYDLVKNQPNLTINEHEVDVRERTMMECGCWSSPNVQWVALPEQGKGACPDCHSPIDLALPLWQHIHDGGTAAEWWASL